MISLRAIIGLIFILLLSSLNVYAADITYQGKVIDADTKKPIEGAVVVAVWDEERAFITGPDTRTKESKKTLTDKNGEFTITGPKCEVDYMNPYISFLFGIYYVKSPRFKIYKSGYERFPEKYTFRAYTYIDKRAGLEGIIIEVWEKEEEYYKQYQSRLAKPIEREGKLIYDATFGVSFFPMKDPEQRLRSLDIPFDYPDDVMRIGKDETACSKFFSERYTVIGLKKIKMK